MLVVGREPILQRLTLEIADRLDLLELVENVLLGFVEVARNVSKNGQSRGYSVKGSMRRALRMN